VWQNAFIGEFYFITCTASPLSFPNRYSSTYNTFYGIYTYNTSCERYTLASSPGSPIFFNTRERKEREPGIQCHVINVGKMALRQACHKASISTYLASFVD
jgi:hypothetical protein